MSFHPKMAYGATFHKSSRQLEDEGPAFVYTPEELAYELGAGQVSLVVEPVPLFDRAVSAALDTLAARQSPAGAAA